MVGKPFARHALGAWIPGDRVPVPGIDALREGLERLAEPLCIVEAGGRLAVARGGEVRLGAVARGEALPLLGYVPPRLPESLGDPAFRNAHGLRYAYVVGEMANGIASVELVEAAARAGMLGFFGAAGLPPSRVEEAILRLRRSLGELPWGVNLIHSPADAALEAAHAELLIRHGVRIASASAYLDLTPHVVRYRVHGIHRAPDGTIVAPNRLVAKVSRVEVARRFLAPPPEHLLRELVEAGAITEEQARLAERIPMADDVTAEADSGGHTDNRPLVVILPAIQAVRDELHAKHRFATRPRVGAAGGIATPAATAAAFALGAAYVVTGSVNQACVESGTSDLVRRMLAEARSTDVAMAPAADMFEMGVEVQVLSRGTLFPVRAQKLYELYRSHDSLDQLPAEAKRELEEKYFRCSLEEAWEGCKRFFAERDPRQIERAERDPKHKLALVFRSYLGRSSGWANDGVEDRRLDFQIWCGPAMGAFNEWAKGSHLEAPEARRVATVGRNLLCGSAYLSRIQALRSQGLEIPAELERFAPRTDEALEAMVAAPQPVAEAALQPSGARATEEERAPDGEPIAIVGMAALFPKARDLAGYWRLLRRGEDAVGEIPASHWSTADYTDPDPKAKDKTWARRGAFLDPVPFDPTEFGIPPNILEATDTSQLLALVVAKRALEDAGYGEGVEWNRSRASVLLGVTGTQELVISLGARLGHPHWRRALAEAGVPADQAEEVVERIGRAYVEWQESSFPGLLGNVVAGRIANRFDLGGTNAVVDAACASSLGALHLAILELRSGKSDLVLTGGVDTLSDIFMHMCFTKTPALSQTNDARPFSAEADGTLLGEGLGMLVLKRLSDAERDGDRIYAVIRGLGTASDGRAKSIYAPLPDGQARALRAAYDAAGVSPGTVGLVEAHGTGTRAGDVCEVEALRRVFGEATDEKAVCALGSVKSQIGHTKAAAGAAGVIKAALALHHKVVPPTIKVKRPNPALQLEASPFYLPLEARPWLRGPHPRRAGVSSFGFGGSNFHVVLEEYRSERTAPAWDGSVEIVAFSGADAASIEAELAAFERAEEIGPFAAASRARFDGAAPHRLVLAFDTGGDRKELAQAARRRLAAGPGHDAGIHYGTGRPGKLAFLFPGQGAQRVGMLRDLANHFPEALAALEAAGDVARAIYPPSSFDPEERQRQQAHLTRTEVAQPALGAVELGALEVLRRFGVEPDLVAGHSYGELVALFAAGVYDAAALRRISKLRGELMAGDGGDRGTMLAVLAPLEQVGRIVAEARLDVVLANRNAPAQGVLSGSREAIDRAEAACREAGLRTSRIPVGAAFHSPLVADAAAALRRGLEEIPFAAPRIPAIANRTAAPYPTDPDAARALLAEQIASPVRFVEVVERLHEAGATTFVEVGPRAILTGLVRSILAGREHRAVALDASQGAGDGIFDLADLLAGLAAAGHAVRLAAWEERPMPPRTAAREPRKRRMNVPLTGANYRAPQPPLPPRKRRAPAPERASEKQPMSQPLDPQTTALLLEALRTNGETLRALQLLQEQTAQAHQRFLEGQIAAQQSFAALLLAQQQLVAGGVALPQQPAAGLESPTQGIAPQPLAGLGLAAGAIPGIGLPPVQPAVAGTVQGLPTAAPPPAHAHLAAVAQPGVQPTQPMANPAVQGAAPLAAPAVQPAVTAAPPAPAGAPANVAIRPPAGAVRQPAPVNGARQATAPQQRSNGVLATPARGVDVVAELLAVVSEATGYPTEMLELDMDLEGDLGIDSIKRVEILSLLGKRIPDAPAVDPEKLGDLRTLRQVAAFVSGGAAGKPAASATPASATPAAAPATPGPAAGAAASTGTADAQAILFSVVSELTGYPTEMLDLGMDLEADLGIDSIKRVEILSLLGKRLPDAPAVDPEKLSGLRTLRQVLEFVAPRSRASGGSTTAAEAQEPAADAQRSALLRREVVACRLPRQEATALPEGPFALVDDGAGVAAALAGLLREADREATVVPPGATAAGAKAIVICGGPGSDERALLQAFATMRSAASDLAGGGLVCTVARRDGAFGRLDPLEGEVCHGALAGLAKTAAREWRGVRALALDVAAALPPEEAARAICAELATPGPEERGVGPAGRIGLALVEAAAPEPADRLRPGDLVVVSGGARGVTAACAIELARRRRPTLLLLGRSELGEPEPAWLEEARDEAAIQRALLAHRFAGARPSPSELRRACAEVLARREIRATLAAIEAAGAQALYRAVDTRDAEAVAAAVAEARAAHGPVRGIVHGAGVLRDKAIAEKSDADFEAVVSTKVAGLQSLLAAAGGDDLAFLALFTSVSGRFGRRGQVDYAMANELLTARALAEAARRPGCRVVAFDWGPWEGGMVTPALARTFASEGIALIPIEAGARLFATEVLAAPGGAVELTIGAGFPGGIAPEPPTMRLAARLRIDPARHRYLEDHRLSGKPVLPVAMQIEAMADAARRAVPGGEIRAVESFQLYRGVIVEEPIDLFVFLGGCEEGRIAAELRDAADRVRSRATIVVGAPQPLARSVEATALAAAEIDPERLYAERELFHGPRFRGIRAVHALGAQGIDLTLRAAVDAAAWVEGVERFTTSPLALDGVFQALVLWTRRQLGAPSLPSALGAWRQATAELPEEVRAVVRIRSHDETGAIADCDLLGPDGAVVAQVEGYRCTASPTLEAAWRGAPA